MKLSILIPTHNRPSLFARCLLSVLPQINTDIEVIVNNDSNDIKPIEWPNVTYHYNKFDNMSLIYKFLLEQATGEYVYFLEDDDYLVSDFASIDLDADLIVGNYCPTYNPDYLLECLKCYVDKECDPNQFVSELNLEHLQLGQHIFKRSTIVDFEFPMDNNVHNDINLVLHGASNSKKIRTMRKIMYYQTIDGGDNVSFEGTNPSVNTTKSLDFLKQYELYQTASHNTGP